MFGYNEFKDKPNWGNDDSIEISVDPAHYRQFPTLSYSNYEEFLATHNSCLNLHNGFLFESDNMKNLMQRVRFLGERESVVFELNGLKYIEEGFKKYHKIVDEAVQLHRVVAIHKDMKLEFSILPKSYMQLHFHRFVWMCTKPYEGQIYNLR